MKQYGQAEYMWHIIEKFIDTRMTMLTAGQKCSESTHQPENWRFPHDWIYFRNIFRWNYRDDSDLPVCCRWTGRRQDELHKSGQENLVVLVIPIFLILWYDWLGKGAFLCRK